MRTRAALIGIIFILLFSVSAGVASAEDTVKIYGYVTDSAKPPVSGVWVTVFDENYAFLKNTLTSATGYYEFSVPRGAIYSLLVQDINCEDPFLAKYIPVWKKEITIPDDEQRVDFELKAGANIIIDAYNNDGTLLRNKEFTESTNSKVFATDLNDMPYCAEYQGVRDSYCLSNGGSWDDAIPAFVVLPEKPYRIHILWEIPGFGKVMLSADNEGKGYSIENQGGGLTLNFNYEAAKSKLASLKEDYNLFRSQGYSITESVSVGMNSSEVHLGAAERYLFQTASPDMKSAVAELNLALKDASYAHEQLYLDKAKPDIEKYRKGDAILRVTDDESQPLVNVVISVNQTSHDFPFAICASSHDNEQEYVDLLKQAGINCVYVGFSYGDVQPEPGRFELTGIDNQVDTLLSDGFTLIGSLGWLFYRAPWGTAISCPAYLDNMSFDEIKTNVYNYMYTLADRYKGKVDIWEAITEPCMFNQFSWTWNQKFEIYTIAGKAIKDANPKAAILSWNPSLPYEHCSSYKPDDFNLDDTAEQMPFGNLRVGLPYPEFIRVSIEKQVPLDLIGLFLENGCVTDYVTSMLYSLVLDLVSISNMVDQYSNYGKSVFFREHRAPSIQVEGSNWWHRPWDEQTQAEYVRQFYALVFSKPVMRGIGWSTGFSDDVSSGGGGLLDTNLNPKPAYFALKDLVNSWTTNTTGITDENGKFEFRGFAGDYTVTIETAEGQKLETAIHINEQQTNEITIEFPSSPPATPIPSSSTTPEAEPTTSPSVTTKVETSTATTTTPVATTAATTVKEETPSSTNTGTLIIAVVSGGIIVGALLTLFLFRRKSVK